MWATFAAWRGACDRNSRTGEALRWPRGNHSQPRQPQDWRINSDPALAQELRRVKTRPLQRGTNASYQEACEDQGHARDLGDLRQRSGHGRSSALRLKIGRPELDLSVCLHRQHLTLRFRFPLFVATAFLFNHKRPVHSERTGLRQASGVSLSSLASQCLKHHSTTPSPSSIPQVDTSSPAR